MSVNKVLIELMSRKRRTPNISPEEICKVVTDMTLIHNDLMWFDINRELINSNYLPLQLFYYPVRARHQKYFKFTLVFNAGPIANSIEIHLTVSLPA